MGIEKFFNSLSGDKNITAITKSSENKIKCSHIYFDFNSIIHAVSGMLDTDREYLLYSIIVFPDVVKNSEIYEKTLKIVDEYKKLDLERIKKEHEGIELERIIKEYKGIDLEKIKSIETPEERIEEYKKYFTSEKLKTTRMDKIKNYILDTIKNYTEPDLIKHIYVSIDGA